MPTGEALVNLSSNINNNRKKVEQIQRMNDSSAPLSGRNDREIEPIFSDESLSNYLSRNLSPINTIKTDPLRT